MKGIIIIVSIIRMMMSVVVANDNDNDNDDERLCLFTDSIKLNSIQIRHDRWYYGWLLT